MHYKIIFEGINVLVPLIVQIRWNNGNLSKCIKYPRVHARGGGGVTTHFIFNIYVFYQDMIGKVSDMPNGVKIGSHTIFPVTQMISYMYF